MGIAAREIRLVTMAAAVIACLLAAIPIDAKSAFPGRPGSLVFNLVFLGDDRVHPTGGLYALSSEQQLYQLTANPWDYEPSFAPSGRKFVFRRVNTEEDGLYTLDFRTGTTERITTDGADTGPAFGPRGLIAFSRFSMPTRSYDLYLRTPRGHVRRLTSTPAADEEPVFTPDGRRIIFVRSERRYATVAQEHPEVHQPPALYSIRTDGTGLEAIGSIDPVFGFDISPDGRRIVFDDSGETPGVWSAELSGIGLSRITSDGWGPSFSPAGNEVVYSNYSGLWARRADGRRPPRLLYAAEYSKWDGTGELLMDPAWQPLPDRGASRR